MSGGCFEPGESAVRSPDSPPCQMRRGPAPFVEERPSSVAQPATLCGPVALRPRIAPGLPFREVLSFCMYTEFPEEEDVAAFRGVNFLRAVHASGPVERAGRVRRSIMRGPPEDCWRIVAHRILEVVLINRQDLAPSGAGEPASVATAPAIANAVFDATGARLRTTPFTRARTGGACATSLAASPPSRVLGAASLLFRIDAFLIPPSCDKLATGRWYNGVVYAMPERCDEAGPIPR